MTPNYAGLYQLKENFAESGALRVGPDDTSLDAFGIALGYIRPNRPVSFAHRSGKQPLDVIWTTYPPLKLISTDFRDLLQQEGFTGWSTYPATVSGCDNKPPTHYFGLSVIGRAGPIDNSRSEMVWRTRKGRQSPRFQRYVGKFFTNDEWDGSDFFIPEGRSSIIVTERVRKALQTLRIPNVQFDCLSTLERDLES